MNVFVIYQQQQMSADSVCLSETVYDQQFKRQVCADCGTIIACIRIDICDMCVMSLFTYILAIKNEDQWMKQLRRHSLIIGWIYCCISIFLAFIFLWKVYEIIAYNLPHLIVDSPEAYLLLFVLQIANIIASVMLVMGARKENRFLLLPWLVNFFFSPLIYLVLIDDFHDADLIVALRLIIVYLISIYTWTVVFALYQRIKSSYGDHPKPNSNIFVINLTEGSKNLDEGLIKPIILPTKSNILQIA